MRSVYGLVGVLAAIAAVTVGVLGMPDVMVASLVLAVVLLLAANSDRIAKVKASMSGIEAETRAVIDEARATIDQLRTVAKVAVQANVSLVMRAGRIGGFSHDEKEAIRKASVAALDDLRVPAAEQDEIFREWHTVTRFDYAHHLLGRSEVPAEFKGNLDLQSEWSQLRGGGFGRIPSADEIEGFLRKAGMFNEERRELLEDYRFYEIKKRHRRPEVWKRLEDRDWP